ncbi:hypothetical protein LOOC260_110780 [Paucilactobacillus hokkaidonensis JCM 18461]|uniref:Uncharacterized protein n=1 Tax=Paucilactobacillus hokkaidonensis JCM 18461 TaxID=1291742 RepID=A0A0A1GTL8_9LACO|nr:hypothetical protein LOOC260_110780 [Paucilactobacillus hokkaidonensis JCM 18461]
MLAQAVMLVVFVLGEKISRGTIFMVTAGKPAKVSDYALVFLKSATVTKQYRKLY